MTGNAVTMLLVGVIMIIFPMIGFSEFGSFLIMFALIYVLPIALYVILAPRKIKGNAS